MKKSMLKSLTLGVCAFFLMASCEKSVKGKWMSADKATFTKHCLAEIKTFVAKHFKELGAGAVEAEEKAICDCYLQKAEANYSFAEEEGEKAISEVKNIGNECAGDIIVGKKGAWTHQYKDFMTKSMAKEMQDSFSPDVAKKMADCIVSKMEQQVDPYPEPHPEEVNKVRVIVKKIRISCAEEIIEE